MSIIIFRSGMGGFRKMSKFIKGLCGIDSDNEGFVMSD